MGSPKSSPSNRRVTRPEHRATVRHSLLPPVPHLRLREPFSNWPKKVWDPSRYSLVNAPTSFTIHIRASTPPLTDPKLTEVPLVSAGPYLYWYEQALKLRLGTPTPPPPPPPPSNPQPTPPPTATRHVYLLLQPTQQYVWHAPMFTIFSPTYVPPETDFVLPIGVNVQFHDDDKSGWEFTGVLQASVNAYLWDHSRHDPGDVPQAQHGYTLSAQAQMAYVLRLNDKFQTVFGVLAQPGVAFQWDPDSQGYRPNSALAVAGVAGLNYSFNDRLALGGQIQAGPTYGSPVTFDTTLAVNLTWNFVDFPRMIKLSR